MSFSKIILSIFIVTYGSNASLFDGNANKLPPGPYYDTLGDYYVEEPLMEAAGVDDADDASSMDSDYGESNWDQSSEVFLRQLPESGELKLNQDKKSQTWCKIKKVIKHHHEAGYEFFPKSYSEYECLPHTNFDGSSENSIFSSDACPVHHGRCVAIQKQNYYLKRNLLEKCWKLEKNAVKVGCKCLPSNTK